MAVVSVFVVLEMTKLGLKGSQNFRFYSLLTICSYGYAEELEYIKDLGKMPYQMDDEISRRIANQLYAAALTYDRLVKNFYPEYVDRSSNFFAIWDCYQLSSNKEREI